MRGTSVPGQNLCLKHKTPHRKEPASGLKPGHSYCEAMVLTTAPWNLNHKITAMKYRVVLFSDETIKNVLNIILHIWVIIWMNFAFLCIRVFQKKNNDIDDVEVSKTHNNCIKYDPLGMLGLKPVVPVPGTDKWGGLNQDFSQITHANHQEGDFHAMSVGVWVNNDLHWLCRQQSAVETVLLLVKSQIWGNGERIARQHRLAVCRMTFKIKKRKQVKSQ